MKSFKEYEVKKLSAEEISKTKGGWCWLCGAFIGSFLYEVASDWDANVEAFKAGYAQGV